MGKLQPIDMFVVYDHPIDIPDKIVIRKHQVLGSQHFGTDEFRVYDTVEQARSEMEKKNLFCLGRSQNDDPKIIEVWI